MNVLTILLFVFGGICLLCSAYALIFRKDGIFRVSQKAVDKYNYTEEDKKFISKNLNIIFLLLSVAVLGLGVADLFNEESLESIIFCIVALVFSIVVIVLVFMFLIKLQNIQKLHKK